MEFPFPCIDEGQSEAIAKLLRNTNEIIQETALEYPAMGRPLIAGGSVRDIMFGTALNDVDIFFDTSRLDPDERDDIILLFGLGVMERVAALIPGGEYVSNVLSKMEGTAYDKVKDNTMSVWSSGYFSYHSATNKQFARAFGTRFQFVGKSAREIETPKEFVKEFDYQYVKAWIDRDSGEAVYSDEFKKGGDISFEDITTYNRASRWAARFTTESPFPFKFSSQYKEAPKIKKRLFPLKITAPPPPLPRILQDPLARLDV